MTRCKQKGGAALTEDTAHKNVNQFVSAAAWQAEEISTGG